MQTRYVHGDAVDQLFARISSGGIAAWYLTDRLGSVRDIVNSSGSVIDHIDYDGFGKATETQQTNGDRYKWTGREFDTETTLQYNRARYYDPFSGRWVEEDPLGFMAGDPNLYRYCFNATTFGCDPSGLVPPYPADTTNSATQSSGPPTQYPNGGYQYISPKPPSAGPGQIAGTAGGIPLLGNPMNGLLYFAPRPWQVPINKFSRPADSASPPSEY